MIEAIETAILEKLKEDAKNKKSVLSMIEIERCPEDATSRLLDASTGSVWIHYAETAPSEPQGIYSAMQNDTLTFDLDVITRNLRTGRDAITTDDVGAYAVMGRVRFVLTGFQPVKSAQPMYMAKAGLTTAGDGFWHYTMRFIVKVPYFAEKDEPEMPLAKKVTWQDKPDNKHFTIPPEEEL